MTSALEWPAAVALQSARLVLEPLRAAHAVELAPLLSDIALHEFIGGTPASAAELTSRFQRQSVGHSPDGREGWLNWVVRRRDNDAAAGLVQATVHGDGGGGSVADLAWVVVPGEQRQGFAREAALSMADWLRGHGIHELVAYINPRHLASQAVARALGLAPTTRLLDGEVEWHSPLRSI